MVLLSVIVTVTVSVEVGSGGTIEIAVLVTSTVAIVAVDTKFTVVVCNTVSTAVVVDGVLPLPSTFTTEYVAVLRSITWRICLDFCIKGNADD